MPPVLASLPWLPEPPLDHAARRRALEAAPGPIGASLQQLASFRLSPPQAAALGKTIRRCAEAGADLAPLSPFRLGVLASHTADLLTDGLAAAAARHGVALGVTTAPYGQVAQQALDPASIINTARLDAVLLAIDHRWLNLDRPAVDGDADVRTADALETVRGIVEGLRRHGGAPAILQTLPVPPTALFGSLDRMTAGSVRAMVEATNQGLVALARDSGCLVLDVAALAERVGTDAWFDPVQWLAYKLPFSAGFAPVYAEWLGRLLGAARGKARKCLVLDLDNTCWGGVIGDDGLEGIVLGQGSAVGEAFLAVQQMALDLRSRGIVLAVSSRNDDAVARQVFREHPEMLLREAHVTVFQANWTDKASNLEAIAQSLNIGLDALVLLDDNPAERAQVRAALPMVAVPELPADPSWFPWFLSAAGYFEATSFSIEDRNRAQSYSADARRVEVKAQARDLDDYLASLGMKLAVAPFDAQGRGRITQLINKTNQFNLTTRRYTEAEVAAFEADPSVVTLQVRLEDRFGDLGMIGVVIGRVADEDGRRTLDLDSWLMSCRVLGRKVEEAMLAQVVRAAAARGVDLIVGTYVPTAKNGMVADHYSRLGFREAGETGGGRRFELPTGDYAPTDLPFEIDASAIELGA